LARATAANVTLVAELRRWRERAWRAEAEVRRLQGALAAAEAAAARTAAPLVHDQVQADHVVERARHEAADLTRQARVRARRLEEEAELVRLEAEVAAWFAAEVTEVGADDDPDPAPELVVVLDGAAEAAFVRFMSDDIADEPSRAWVLGPTG
jgi:hypothetical protein